MLAPANGPDKIEQYAAELAKSNGRPAPPLGPLEQANVQWRALAEHAPAITRVLRRGDGGGDAEYTVELDNGRRFTCTLLALFEPRRIRPPLIEASGQPVAKFVAAQLDPLATALVRAAEDDPAEDAELRGWLAEFWHAGHRHEGEGGGRYGSNVLLAPVSVDEQTTLATVLREPDPPSFRDTDGRAHVRLRRLRAWLQREHGERLTERQLGKRLGRLGFEPVQLAARDDHGPVNGRYWRAPLDPGASA